MLELAERHRTLVLVAIAAALLLGAIAGMIVRRPSPSAVDQGARARAQEMEHAAGRATH